VSAGLASVPGVLDRLSCLCAKIAAKTKITALVFSKGLRAMEYDDDKVAEAVLALLYLTLHEHNRAWKGFDWNALDRLHEKGLIQNPRNRNKSVVLTEEGLKKSELLFQTLFGVKP
jgi:hypothetical protein